MDMLLLMVVWLVLCILVSVYASSKKLDSAGYFLLSLLLSPVVGFIAVAVSRASEKELIAKGHLKRCPFCAELVQPEAIVCRHCGRELAGAAPALGSSEAALSPDRPTKKPSIAVPVVITSVILIGGIVLATLTLTAPARVKANESSAVVTLKTLNAALGAYAAMYADGRKVYVYPDSLRKLHHAGRPLPRLRAWLMI